MLSVSWRNSKNVVSKKSFRWKSLSSRFMLTNRRVVFGGFFSLYEYIQAQSITALSGMSLMYWIHVLSCFSALQTETWSHDLSGAYFKRKWIHEVTTEYQTEWICISKSCMRYIRHLYCQSLDETLKKYYFCNIHCRWNRIKCHDLQDSC